MSNFLASIIVSFTFIISFQAQEVDFTKTNEESISVVLDRCKNFVYNPLLLSQDCILSLDRYFLDKPIWEYAQLDIPRKDYGHRTTYSSFNKRSAYLKYSASDYSLQRIPLWRDIFDGNISERHELVKSVFQIEHCKKLAGGNEKINPNISDLCEAEELYKYATYLDSCLTGIQRAFQIGILPRDNVQFGNGIDVLTSVSVVDEFDLGVNEWIDSNLNIVWLLNTCRYFPTQAFDTNLKIVEFGSDGELSNTIERYKVGYDAALNIAAVSGHEWALYSILPGISFSVQKKGKRFWESLYEINPVLVHRHFSGHHFAQVFTKEESTWHSIKAYFLTIKSSPKLYLNYSDYMFHEFRKVVDVNYLENLLDIPGLLTHTEMFAYESTVDDKLVFPWIDITND